MKRSDLITAGLIAVIGTIAAYVLVGSIMGNPEEKVVSFKYVIADSVNELSIPDSEIFNDSAINPTVDVYVGDCIDQDHDGEISIAEKVICGTATMEEAEEAEKNQNQASELDDVDIKYQELRGSMNTNTNTSTGTGTSTNTNTSTKNSTGTNGWSTPSSSSTSSNATNTNQTTSGSNNTFGE